MFGTERVKVANMNYRYLGKTGIKVSEIALGCMTFETNYSKNITEKKAFEILDFYVDNGGNFFDMADNYPGVEELFGRWLKTRNDRDQFVIASKVRFPSLKRGINDVGLTRKHMIDAIDTALKKIGAEYIDLYQAHCFDEFTPLYETMRVFEDLIRAGKIRYAGGSNFAGRHIAKTGAYSKLKDLPHFQSYQIQYNLLTRTPEWEVIPAAADAGSSITVWSPLASGWLTGKYKKDEIPPENSRMGKLIQSIDQWNKLQTTDLSSQLPHPRSVADAEQNALDWIKVNNEKKWHVIDAVCDVAKKYERTPSQIALAWLLKQDQVCSAIVGVSSLSQLEDNLKAMDVVIEPNELDWLNKVSYPSLVYPYDFLNDYGKWR